MWWTERSKLATALYQFSNDNHAYPTALIQPITEIYEQIGKTLGDVEGFEFELGLTEDEKRVCTCRQSIRTGQTNFTGFRACSD